MSIKFLKNFHSDNKIFTTKQELTISVSNRFGKFHGSITQLVYNEFHNYTITVGVWEVDNIKDQIIYEELDTTELDTANQRTDYNEMVLQGNLFIKDLLKSESIVSAELEQIFSFSRSEFIEKVEFSYDKTSGVFLTRRHESGFLIVLIPEDIVQYFSGVK